MDSDKLAELVADACDDRKATDIRLIRVDEAVSYTHLTLPTIGYV